MDTQELNQLYQQLLQRSVPADPNVDGPVPELVEQWLSCWDDAHSAEINLRNFQHWLTQSAAHR